MKLIRLLPAFVLMVALALPAASWAVSDEGIGFTLPWEGKATGQVREFQISVGRVQWEVAPGQVAEAYAYNGQIPGPELRVTEGDTVRVTVTNTLGEPTTVHFHGVDLPVGQDGMPGFSQDPIQPGASYTYEFVATPAGTRWYHSHFNELTQHNGGLYGALIVEPREPQSLPADREYTLMSAEWSQSAAPDLYAQQHVGHEMDHQHVAQPTARPPLDAFILNGKSYPQAAPLVVRQGELVKLRLINAGATETQVFALAGHRLTITDTDGNPLAQPLDAEAVLLGAGERADVQFTADNPGKWRLQSFGPGQLALGLAADIVYEGHESDAVQGFAPGTRPQPASYLQMAGPAHPQTADRAYTFDLSESKTVPGTWTINGQSSPNVVQPTAVAGERIRLTLINSGLEDHPMHLHGHSFQVVGINGQAVDGPLKDTLTVRRGEVYDVEFVANNPGTWLLHCHNLVHMLSGMSTEVVYQ